MKIVKPNRVTRTYTQRLVAEPGVLFPLLCPVCEADWIDNWGPTFVISSSGLAEPDCVFATPAEPYNAIWYITRHEPAAGFVEMNQRKTTPCRASIVVGTLRCSVLWILLRAAAHVQAQTPEFRVYQPVVSKSGPHCTSNAQEQTIANFMRQDPILGRHHGTPLSISAAYFWVKRTAEHHFVCSISTGNSPSQKAALPSNIYFLDGGIQRHYYETTDSVNYDLNSAKVG